MDAGRREFLTPHAAHANTADLASPTTKSPRRWSQQSFPVVLWFSVFFFLRNLLPASLPPTLAPAGPFDVLLMHAAHSPVSRQLEPAHRARPSSASVGQTPITEQPVVVMRKTALKKHPSPGRGSTSLPTSNLKHVVPYRRYVRVPPNVTSRESVKAQNEARMPRSVCEPCWAPDSAACWPSVPCHANAMPCRTPHAAGLHSKCTP